ncbi:MAG: ankyrin repeat domain-containing protein [Leptospiraceae bacterium]|nr:ankyrin repeat domain-containing protein [Leptospiraceae bacterium]
MQQTRLSSKTITWKRTLDLQRAAVIMFLLSATLLPASPTDEFLFAVKTSNLAKVKSTLANGANVNARDSRNNATAVMYLALLEKEVIFREVLQYKPDLNLRTEKGDTALNLAVRNKKHVSIQLLLEAGALVDSANNDLITPLIEAAALGDLESVKLLLVHQANINAQSKDGYTALAFAAGKAHPQVASLLLQHGAAVDSRDQTGFTPLLQAAADADLRTVQVLVAAKADVNAQSRNGITALMAAANRGDKEIVRFLLDNGADPELKTSIGKTALHFAESKRNLEIVTLLDPDLARAHELPATEALLVARLVDNDDIPDPGIVCSFQNLDTQAVFSGTTDSAGELRLVLKKAAKYQVACNKFGNSVVFDEKLALIATDQPLRFQLGLKIIYNTVYQKTYTLKNVYFDYNQFSLRKQSMPALVELHKTMLANPDMLIEIAGHTDSRGAKDHNQKLSRLRADSVRNFLIEKGIKPQRIIAKGYGASQPIASNDTKIGQQQNRRTEVRIIKQQSAPTKTE